ncbi:phage terminase small subunit [Pararhodospirillum photometricum]|nr:phage terminase small subunit [Pararhodospirillum photometricum]
MSLARAHYTRVLAEQGGAPAPPPEAVSLRAKIEQALALHARALKDIQSLERKVAFKREVLPDYTAYVDGCLAADAGGPDPVLMTTMVWRLDVGDYEGAMVIARYALRHDLALPERFARSFPTWLVEELAEAALDNKLTVPGALSEAMELTARADMPDEVRAKGHKAMGLGLRDTAPAEALAHLKRALALHKGVGVKAEVARLERARDGAATSCDQDG